MKERTDAKKNKAKIVKTVLKNPLLTQREIAKESWVWKTTVQEHLKGLNTTKDDRILWICDTDLENVILWQNILQKRLQEKQDELKTQEIVQIIQEGTKRYTLFKGNATDSEWGLNIQDIKIEIIS